MTQQIEPGDRVIVYQYSDPTVTLSDRARLRAAAENPWQLPPSGETWRKLPLWTSSKGEHSPIVVQAVDATRSTCRVTCEDWPEPVRSDGVEIPLASIYIEIVEKHYAQRLARERATAASNATPSAVCSPAQRDRSSHGRQSAQGSRLRRSDRTSAAPETADAQPTLF